MANQMQMVLAEIHVVHMCTTMQDPMIIRSLATMMFLLVLSVRVMIRRTFILTASRPSRAATQRGLSTVLACVFRGTTIRLTWWRATIQLLMEFALMRVVLIKTLVEQMNATTMSYMYTTVIDPTII